MYTEFRNPQIKLNTNKTASFPESMKMNESTVTVLKHFQHILEGGLSLIKNSRQAFYLQI